MHSLCTLMHSPFLQSRLLSAHVRRNTPFVARRQQVSQQVKNVTTLRPGGHVFSTRVGAGQIGNLLHGLDVLLAEDVGIGVHCQVDIAVTHDFLAQAGMNPRLGQPCPGSVAEAVEVNDLASLVLVGDPGVCQVFAEHVYHAIFAGKIEQGGVRCLSPGERASVSFSGSEFCSAVRRRRVMPMNLAESAK